MRRERIEKPKAPRKRTLPEILPLDPRDPDVVHAKALIDRAAPPGRRAA
jgi:hypothetical protein